MDSKKSIVKQLEDVLNFLKSAPIENEEALSVIKKPLDDLQSTLKYIPTGQYFNHLPTEIKMNIMSYVCDSNAFTAASVCQEWKVMLGSRFKEEDTVTIGSYRILGMDKTFKDTKKYGCNDYKDCHLSLSPEVMLKASADHKLNVHLEFFGTDYPVTEVDPKVVTEGLLSASRFTIYGRNPLSFDQLDELFKGLEKSDKVMEEVYLKGVDLTELDQDRLVHCLVDKMKSFTKGYVFPLKLEAVKQLLNNISTRLVQLKSLVLDNSYDFSTLINPEDLKKLLNKMDKIKLEGTFTSEQIEAAKSLPGVKVYGPYVTIIKG